MSSAPTRPPVATTLTVTAETRRLDRAAVATAVVVGLVAARVVEVRGIHAKRLVRLAALGGPAAIVKPAKCKGLI